MPRHADHEERRAELADTVSRIILEHGLESVSVRAVARESGWSVGALRYYFPRQEDLLFHAFRQMIDRAVARIEVAEQTDMSDPVEWAYRLLCTTAPVNDETRRDIRIWMAFVDRGLAREQVAELMDEVWLGGRHFSRRMVAAMAGLPLPTDMEAPLEDSYLEETSAVLHVLWNGISFQGIMAPDRLDATEICRLTRRILTTISQRIAAHQASHQAVS
jgi:AcrR family transcriptional regulator